MQCGGTCRQISEIAGEGVSFRSLSKIPVMKYSIHSGWMLANFTTLAHRSVAAAKSCRNSAEDINNTGLPMFSIRYLILGSLRVALTSRLSRSIISVGVFRGAPMPDQPPPT